MSLHGVCTIALTPFTEEGELDEVSIESLSNFYVDAGIHGVTILGIMSEAHKLSDAERQVVTERYVSAIGGRGAAVGGRLARPTKGGAERPGDTSPKPRDANNPDG